MPNPKKTYQINCTGSTGPKIIAMADSAREITRSTFMCNTCGESRQQLERDLGYAVGNESGIKMSEDGYVTYHSSWYDGERCYYLCYSRVEYIFLDPK